MKRSSKTSWVQTEPRNRAAFAKALARLMAKHGDTHLTLLRTVDRPEEPHANLILKFWSKGIDVPRWKSSFNLLNRIERHYRLPKNHFKDILYPHSARLTAIRSVTPNQRHVMRWHLPENFDSRSFHEQKEILTWVRQNVLAGATDFGKFMREMASERYGVRLPQLIEAQILKRRPIERYSQHGGLAPIGQRKRDAVAIEAPARLAKELMDLVEFKTATISPSGFRRYTSWSKYTAEIRVETYGRLFGALIGAPISPLKGFGLPSRKLTMALLLFPSVWDWYLGWRERRRGFFTKYELNTIVDAISLLRRDTGWLRQNPRLAKHLSEIAHLVPRSDLIMARSNWDELCDSAITYLRNRARELRRIIRTHRDPFEMIMPVLKSDNPLAEYKKIVTEIVSQMPDECTDPVGVAESVRAYLMLRFGMHMGLRQRNMREMMLCPKGQVPRSHKVLEDMKRGEIRWCNIAGGWEVYMPALAFKNWDSSFFRKGPYRAILPDLEGLYKWIDSYLARHRMKLLNGARDPKTFFVGNIDRAGKSASLNANRYYFVWRSTIERYGIFNPYTGRGAIKGLLPHGPHSIRDVIATHVIKHTASYELAGFAIHDTADVVKAHYCRFLPEEKTAIASRILNKVWQPARPTQSSNG